MNNKSFLRVLFIESFSLSPTSLSPISLRRALLLKLCPHPLQQVNIPARSGCQIGLKIKYSTWFATQRLGPLTSIARVSLLRIFWFFFKCWSPKNLQKERKMIPPTFRLISWAWMPQWLVDSIYWIWVLSRWLQYCIQLLIDYIYSLITFIQFDCSLIEFVEFNWY